MRSHGEKVFFQEFRWDFEKPIIKSRPIFGELNEFKNKLENSFHYDCNDIIKAGNIPEAYPSSISVAKLSTIYFKEWLKENPSDLTSDYIYPYKKLIRRFVILKMAWFRRKDKKINSPEKKEIPDGLWEKCPSCEEVLYRPEVDKNFLSAIIATTILELIQNYI